MLSLDKHGDATVAMPGSGGVQPHEFLADVVRTSEKPLFTPEGKPNPTLQGVFTWLARESGQTEFNDLVDAPASQVIAVTQLRWFKEFANTFPTDVRLMLESQGNPPAQFVEMMQMLGHIDPMLPTPGRRVDATVVLGGTLQAHMNRLSWLEKHIDTFEPGVIVFNGADRKVLAIETEAAFSQVAGRPITFDELPFAKRLPVAAVPTGTVKPEGDTVVMVNEGTMMLWLVQNTDKFPKIVTRPLSASMLSAEALQQMGRSKAGTIEATTPLALQLQTLSDKPLDLEVVSSQPHAIRQGLDIAWGVGAKNGVKLQSVEAIGSGLQLGENNIYAPKTFLLELGKRLRIEGVVKGYVAA